MNYFELFSTPQRLAIIKHILMLNNTVRITDTANTLKLSKGLVAKYFNILVKNGILKKEKKQYSLIESPALKGIRILDTLQKFQPRYFTRFGFIKAAGIYGSCTDGTATEGSDIDLWIMTEEDRPEQLAAFSAALKKKIPQVNIVFLGAEKLKNLKSGNQNFYQTLVVGSIMLYGEPDALQL